MSINSTTEDFKGDTATYAFTVKLGDVAEDITGWKIIAEIGDGELKIKKATANVSGGSDSMILITDAANGKFEIYQNKDETVNFGSDSYIEVAYDTGTIKDTLWQSTLSLIDININWDTIT